LSNKELKTEAVYESVFGISKMNSSETRPTIESGKKVKRSKKSPQQDSHTAPEMRSTDEPPDDKKHLLYEDHFNLFGEKLSEFCLKLLCGSGKSESAILASPYDLNSILKDETTSQNITDDQKTKSKQTNENQSNEDLLKELETQQTKRCNEEMIKDSINDISDPRNRGPTFFRKNTQGNDSKASEINSSDGHGKDNNIEINVSDARSKARDGENNKIESDRVSNGKRHPKVFDSSDVIQIITKTKVERQTKTSDKQKTSDYQINYESNDDVNNNTTTNSLQTGKSFDMLARNKESELQSDVKQKLEVTDYLPPRKTSQVKQTSQSEVTPKSQLEVKQKCHSEDRQKSESEDKQKSQSDVKQKSQSEVKQKSQLEDKLKSQSEVKQKPQSEDTLKSQSEGKQKSQSDVKPKSQPEDKQKSQSEVKQKSQSEDKQKSQSDVKPKPQSEDKQKSQSEVKPKSQSDVKPKSQSDVKPKSQSEVSPKSLSQVKQNLAATDSLQSGKSHDPLANSSNSRGSKFKSEAKPQLPPKGSTIDEGNATTARKDNEIHSQVAQKMSPNTPIPPQYTKDLISAKDQDYNSDLISDHSKQLIQPSVQPTKKKSKDDREKKRVKQQTMSTETPTKERKKKKIDSIIPYMDEDYKYYRVAQDYESLWEHESANESGYYSITTRLSSSRTPENLSAVKTTHSYFTEDHSMLSSPTERMSFSISTTDMYTSTPVSTRKHYEKTPQNRTYFGIGKFNKNCDKKYASCDDFIVLYKMQGGQLSNKTKHDLSFIFKSHEDRNDNEYKNEVESLSPKSVSTHGGSRKHKPRERLCESMTSLNTPLRKDRGRSLDRPRKASSETWSLCGAISVEILTRQRARSSSRIGRRALSIKQELVKTETEEEVEKIWRQNETNDFSSQTEFHDDDHVGDVEQETQPSHYPEETVAELLPSALRQSKLVEPQIEIIIDKEIKHETHKPVVEHFHSDILFSNATQDRTDPTTDEERDNRPKKYRNSYSATAEEIIIETTIETETFTSETHDYESPATTYNYGEILYIPSPSTPSSSRHPSHSSQPKTPRTSEEFNALQEPKMFIFDLPPPEACGLVADPGTIHVHETTPVKEKHPSFIQIDLESYTIGKSPRVKKDSSSSSVQKQNQSSASSVEKERRLLDESKSIQDDKEELAAVITYETNYCQQIQELTDDEEIHANLNLNQKQSEELVNLVHFDDNQRVQEDNLIDFDMTSEVETDMIQTETTNTKSYSEDLARESIRDNMGFDSGYFHGEQSINNFEASESNENSNWLITEEVNKSLEDSIRSQRDKKEDKDISEIPEQNLHDHATVHETSSLTSDNLIYNEDDKNLVPEFQTHEEASDVVTGPVENFDVPITSLDPQLVTSDQSMHENTQSSTEEHLSTETFLHRRTHEHRSTVTTSHEYEKTIEKKIEVSQKTVFFFSQRHMQIKFSDFMFMRPGFNTPRRVDSFISFVKSSFR